MDLFGLEPNKKYDDGENISIKHKNGTWYTLVRTTAKMAVVAFGIGEKRVHFNSIVDVDRSGVLKEEPHSSDENPIRNEEPLSKDTDSDGFLTKEKMNSIHDDIFGPGSEYFNDDFGMASNPDLVKDNDTMYD